jgi:hypothetical protein
VVSNQVSLIAVQAGGLQARSEDATTVETARRIRTLAAATLGELRQMVLLLRDGDPQGADLAPPPTTSAAGPSRSRIRTRAARSSWTRRRPGTARCRRTRAPRATPGRRSRSLRSGRLRHRASGPAAYARRIDAARFGESRSDAVKLPWSSLAPPERPLQWHQANPTGPPSKTLHRPRPYPRATSTGSVPSSHSNSPCSSPERGGSSGRSTSWRDTKGTTGSPPSSSRSTSPSSGS